MSVASEIRSCTDPQIVRADRPVRFGSVRSGIPGEKDRGGPREEERDDTTTTTTTDAARPCSYARARKTSLNVERRTLTDGRPEDRPFLSRTRSFCRRADSPGPTAGQSPTFDVCQFLLRSPRVPAPRRPYLPAVASVGRAGCAAVILGGLVLYGLSRRSPREIRRDPELLARCPRVEERDRSGVAATPPRGVVTFARSHGPRDLATLGRLKSIVPLRVSSAWSAIA